MSSVDLELPNYLDHFNWEKGKIFYYIAKCGSFTKAAFYLHTTQSVLSRRIIEFEQSLGVTLFIRSTHGIKLTRKGEELFFIVENMFLSFRTFTHRIYVESQRGKEKKRKIRISSTYNIISYVLTVYLVEYTMLYPNITFELVNDPNNFDVILNDIDIAIRLYDPQARGVAQEGFLSLEKKLFASDKYIQKYGEPYTIEELAFHQLITFSLHNKAVYNDEDWILRLGKEKGELYEPVFIASSLESIVKAAKMGKGIIGSYSEIDIIKSAGLKNILSEEVIEKTEWNCVYPTFLANDHEVIRVKNYLQSKILKANNLNAE